MLRRVVIVLASVLLVASCRVDVTIDLVIRDDGTGELTVVAAADADVVAQAPGLAEDLRFDDAVAAGWVVEGPTPTEAGGLTVTLRHPVTSTQDATNLLSSLGPPLGGMQVVRSTNSGTTTTELAGQLALVGGFDAFADSDLLAAVGGTPFADRLAASGATPAGSMSVQLRVTLPGEVQTLQAPLDGSALDVSIRAEQGPGPGWASFLSTAALVALVAWLAVVAIVVVLVARRRRHPRGPSSLDRLRELDAHSP